MAFIPQYLFCQQDMSLVIICEVLNTWFLVICDLSILMIQGLILNNKFYLSSLLSNQCVLPTPIISLLGTPTSIHSCLLTCLSGPNKCPPGLKPMTILYDLNFGALTASQQSRQRSSLTHIFKSKKHRWQNKF